MDCTSATEPGRDRAALTRDRHVELSDRAFIGCMMQTHAPVAVAYSHSNIGGNRKPHLHGRIVKVGAIVLSELHDRPTTDDEAFLRLHDAQYGDAAPFEHAHDLRAGFSECLNSNVAQRSSLGFGCRQRFDFVKSMGCGSAELVECILDHPQCFSIGDVRSLGLRSAPPLG